MTEKEQIKWERLKRFYQTILEGVPAPTKEDLRYRTPYAKSYRDFMSSIKRMERVFRSWEIRKRREKELLSRIRLMTVLENWKVICPEIDFFWIMCVAYLCDRVAEILGLEYDPKTYKYIRVKKKKEVGK